MCGRASLRSARFSPGTAASRGWSGSAAKGKTRLAQAIFDDQVGDDALAPSEALYADTVEDPQPPPFELVRQLIATRQRMVVILDNCGSDLHQRPAQIVRHSEGRMSLLTLDHDVAELGTSAETFLLGPASHAQIEDMLELRFPTIDAATPGA